MNYGFLNSELQQTIFINPILRFDLNTHKRAKMRNRIKTLFSSGVVFPKALYFSLKNDFLRIWIFSFGLKMRYNCNKVKKKINTPIGKAKISHWPNEISGAWGKITSGVLTKKLFTVDDLFAHCRAIVPKVLIWSLPLRSYSIA